MTLLVVYFVWRLWGVDCDEARDLSWYRSIGLVVHGLRLRRVRSGEMDPISYLFRGVQ